ncbi:MAG: thioesterase family protein [Cyanobacteria bacterium J06638_28]
MTEVFNYPVVVRPHHTDYAGIVWHGTYVAWMEEARVEYLSTHGINFADWVASGVDLPVVDLSLRYRQSLALGMTAVVKAWMAPRRGVRLIWHYDIANQRTAETCVSGTVTLAPVDRHTRKILRRLPEPMHTDFAKFGDDAASK